MKKPCKLYKFLKFFSSTAWQSVWYILNACLFLNELIKNKEQGKHKVVYRRINSASGYDDGKGFTKDVTFELDFKI